VGHFSDKVSFIWSVADGMQIAMVWRSEQGGDKATAVLARRPRAENKNPSQNPSEETFVVVSAGSETRAEHLKRFCYGYEKEGRAAPSRII